MGKKRVARGELDEARQSKKLVGAKIQMNKPENEGEDCQPLADWIKIPKKRGSSSKNLWKTMVATRGGLRAVAIRGASQGSCRARQRAGALSFTDNSIDEVDLSSEAEEVGRPMPPNLQ